MSQVSNHHATDWIEPPFAPEPPPVKEYVLTAEPTRTPGTGRYKVTHNTPDGTRVYRVSWGSRGMHCTCPDAKHRRPGRCKHCQAIARLIGKPHLAGLPDPSF